MMKNKEIVLLLCVALIFNVYPFYISAQTEKKSNAKDSIKVNNVEKTVRLKEVITTAARPIVKSDIDKISYDVSADLDSKSLNVLDILRKVPMITIDGNDAIKVNGSSDFKVYVNGRPNTLMSNKPTEILKGLPASAIKKIEVITNPGAKYDAEGVAGIINIVTESHSKLQGYNMNYSVNAINLGVGGSLYGLFKINKLTLSLNYGTNCYNPPTNYQKTERITFASDDSYRLFSNTDIKNRSSMNYATMEGSYEFDANNLLVISASMNFYNGRNNTNITTQAFNKSGILDYSFMNYHHIKTDLNESDFGLDYQHIFGKEGGRLTFSYRFAQSPAEILSSSLYSNIQDYHEGQTLNDLRTKSNLSIFEHTGQVDYSLVMNKIHTLSLGAKYIYRLNKSDNNEYYRTAESNNSFEKDDDNSLKYRQATDIAASYAEYKLEMKRFSARTGVRYEYSSQKVSYPDGKQSPYSADFNNLVPSLVIAYKMDNTKNLILSYNMRISRPNIWSLNPYIDHSDPTVAKYGNPNLGVAKSNNYSLAFNSFSRKLMVNFTSGFDYSNNEIIGYSFIDKNGIMNTTYGNILNQKDAYVSLYLNYMLTKTTTFNLNGREAYSDFKSLQIGQHNCGFSGNATLSVMQQLPCKIRLTFIGGINGRSVSFQGNANGSSYYRLNLMRSFLKDDRLNISIYGNNFLTNELKVKSTVETQDFVNSLTTCRRDYRNYGISLSLRLGKLKGNVKKTAKTISNDDVINDGMPSTK